MTDELDRYLFNEGTHRYLHREFGAQPARRGVPLHGVGTECPLGRCRRVVRRVGSPVTRSTRANPACGAVGSTAPRSATGTSTA